MTIIAVSGDMATTTAMAICATWPNLGDVVLVEADPTGGDAAAWLDIPADPSLSTVVTELRTPNWYEVEPYCRPTKSGVRVLPAPLSVNEARLAVNEAMRGLVQAAALTSTTCVVDAGSTPIPLSSHPFVASADVHLIVHRQASQSSRAAAVRLQRLAGVVRDAGAGGSAVLVAVVGREPFGTLEIEEFLFESLGIQVEVVGLPIDQLGAAVLAGRAGVSPRRVRRLPLMRAASHLAWRLDDTLNQSRAITGGMYR